MAKTCCMGCCLFFITLLFPPLAVLMEDGCGLHFCLNLLLTACGIIPGVIHAFWVCFFRETEGYPMHHTQTIIIRTNNDEYGRPLVHQV
uniref:Plasma membrane proteolipid 3 n=1 Tax=Strongyloides venezuelensis TaxID=75913 RepID=A0A0K0FVB7_STRVS